MSVNRAGVPARLTRLANAVLMPCFDGTTAPDWVRRRVGEGLGGVCLFARNVDTIERVAALTGSLAAERDSVVVSIDEEAGDVTRIDAATGSRFPGAAALGRADDTALTTHIASEVGTLLAHAGISLNLAPCADVASNPANPVIGVRAFGREPALVARHTAAWVSGQQASGVATCVKHFPGHGDTSADSHRSAAAVTAEMPTIRRESLPPFAAAIDAGTRAVMPGHLLVPALDDVPASISRSWLTDVLRRELGFTGAIVTDALDMAAIEGPYGIPGAAVRALVAGADLLCISGQTRPPEEIDAIRDTIVGAVLDGTLGEGRLAAAATNTASVGMAAMRETGAAAGERVSAAGTPTAVGASPVDYGLQAAKRALESAGPLPRISEPVVVLRCEDTPNIAVGAIPWGPATALVPTPQEIVMHDGDACPSEAVRGAGTVLVVTRDRHRFPWMRDLLADVRQARPDAVLVEMGLGDATADDAPAIATFGATRANARAAVALLGASTPDASKLGAAQLGAPPPAAPSGTAHQP